MRRLALALPDAITCGLFIVTWLYPFRLAPLAVKTFMLVMLLEFLVVHSSGFVAILIYGPETSRGKRTLWLLALSSFYLLFVAAFAAAFREWWPLGAFAWLLLSRLGTVWIDPVPLEIERTRQIILWALSVVLYLGGAFATVFPPVPYLGVTPDLVPEFGLSGSGIWIEEPHRVIAFGALYFGALALCKLFVPAVTAHRGARP